MNTDDRPRFAACMLTIAELYGRPLSPAAVDLFWNALEDFAIDVVEWALAEHIKDGESGRFFPAPAHLLLQVERRVERDARRAWNSLLKAVGGGEHRLTDPIANYIARELGGLSGLGRRTEFEVNRLRADFIADYVTMARAEPAESLMDRLIAPSSPMLPALPARDKRKALPVAALPKGTR